MPEVEQQRAKGTSRLELKNGRINKVKKFVEGPITVKFGSVGIKPNGDITLISIERDGEVVQMTREQAVSFAREILRRLGE